MTWKLLAVSPIPWDRAKRSYGSSPASRGTLIASSGATVSDLAQYRVALEARLLTLEEQLCNAPENSRSRYLLQIEHARLMTELLQVKIAVMRDTLASIRGW
jgi:hypothetical protein